jgi:succinoglycan biosynthesis protein ExoM
MIDSSFHDEDVAMRTEVAICIATCQRPRGLRRLLEALAKLEFRTEAPELRIVVVDNDPAASGDTVRGIIEMIRPQLSGPIVLVEEPRRGISFARNTALDHTGSANWVAFIDDDEVPDPLWLSELLDVQRKTGADVVTGPALPHFIEPPPRWVEEGGFFAPERCATGSALGVAYTSNVLMSAKASSARFEESYALSGSEDSHFFRRLHRQGFAIVWANEALTHEWIPASRATVAWIVRRSFRVGNGLCRISLEASPGPITTVSALAKALSRLVRGSAQLLLFVVGPAHRRVRALDTIASGAGRIVGLMGFSWKEYGRIHGS